MITPERKAELRTLASAHAFTTGFARDTPLEIALLDLMPHGVDDAERRFLAQAFANAHTQFARRADAARHRRHARMAE